MFLKVVSSSVVYIVMYRMWLDTDRGILFLIVECDYFTVVILDRF